MEQHWERRHPWVERAAAAVADPRAGMGSYEGAAAAADTGNFGSGGVPVSWYEVDVYAAALDDGRGRVGEGRRQDKATRRAPQEGHVDQ